MSRIPPRLAVLALTGIAGCLTPPTLEPRRDSGLADTLDATVSPFSVVSLTVRDTRARTWPESGAPRMPTIIVTFSAPLSSADGCVLLAGASDASLIDDLWRAPLRDATSARQIAVRAIADGASISMTPDEQLTPGMTTTLALPAWLASEDGTRLAEPFTREIVISSTASAGARATDGWPPDGAFAVPTRLALAALRFDGQVPDVGRAILVRDASDRAVEGSSEAADCPAIGWPSGTCATFLPAAPLAAATAYVISVAPGTLDATGAPVPTSRIEFVTGDGSSPPSLSGTPPMCANDELIVEGACARIDDDSIALRFVLNAGARIAWRAAWGANGRSGSSIAPRGEATIMVEDLGPSTWVDFTVAATDYAGGEMVFPFSAVTSEPLPTLSITEVRSDPAGAEPRQEYVELLNYGPAPIDLAGLYLSDSDADGDALPSVEVASGARVLLVTDDFDPDDDASGRDGPVPAATVLVRIDHTLGAGGLSNSGEPVFLRDALHRRISAAPATPPPIEGQCIVRVSSRMRSGEPGTFEYDPHGTCTPGR